MECHLVHAIPGRVRLRITEPALGDGLAPAFTSFLAARPGVRSVHVNPSAQSVVVTYAAESASGEDLLSLIRAVSAEELCAGQPDGSPPASPDNGGRQWKGVMAFLDDTLGGGVGGWGGGLPVGLGAAFNAPRILAAAAGGVLGPVAKTLVRGALVVTNGVTRVLASATEQMTDLVAGIGAAGDGSGARKQKAAARHA